jgi:hypothetical protein
MELPGGRNDRPELKIHQLADAAERVFDTSLFSFELSVIADVLPRTAAALAHIGTRRSLTHRRRMEQSSHLADSISFLRGNDMSRYPVAWGGVWDHDSLSLVATHTVRAVRKRINL